VSAMNPRAKLIEGLGQRWLTIGLCLVALIQIVEGTTNGVVVMRAEKHALRTYRDSISSLEYLTTIDRNMGIERALVDDHIFEHETVNMTLIETQLTALDREIEQTGELYAREIDEPTELQLWRRVQGLWSRFEAGKAAALAYSRKLEDDRAHAAMVDVLDEYHELQQTLAELHLINQKDTDEAVAEIAAVQNRTRRVAWVLRTVVLTTIVLLGLWGRRRIASYERRILEDARILEQRNHDLDAFAGRVAHDLKNALAPMAIMPEMLRRSQREPARVLEIANRAERSLGRGVGILDALLAFSRASSKVHGEEAAPLEPVLKNVLEELAPQIARLDVSVEVGPIPAVLLRCDPGLLHVVLANLFGNAIKFLDGRQERLVRISAHEQDETCHIEVEDTGPGIPEEAREQIFEPFYRVAGTRAAGSGIGLATVRRIIESRGGQVTIDSALDRGSRFRVWLPCVARPSTTPRAHETGSKPAPGR
jgi:signal transduction histidine kinase